MNDFHGPLTRFLVFELELTVSLLHERQRLRAIYHLLKSLWLKPTLEPSTEQFWERRAEVSEDVPAVYHDMLDTSRLAA